jgi:cruciform cutting endonuclease 1
MPLLAPWLSKLKISELHRLAVLVGTPCSGTKPVRIAGIGCTLSRLQHGAKQACRPTTRQGELPKQISLVSIDMGIRNLAFAHFTAEVISGGQHRPLHYGPVILNAWRKIDVGSSDASLHQTSKIGPNTRAGQLSKANISDLDDEAAGLSPETSTKIVDKKTESFDPSIYASHAFAIVSDILNRYKPTHILIERQRFRSGGSSAVLEWTIRVGVFEGMLYAVLKTLRETSTGEGMTPVVEGILPTRVNRFWLEGRYTNITDQSNSSDERAKAKITGKEVKKVGQLLEDARINDISMSTSQMNSSLALELSDNVRQLVEFFQREVQRPMNSRRKKAADRVDELLDGRVSKLDDLADCLLQGLAWLNWQNNRFRVQMLGEDAFDLSDSSITSMRLQKKS